MYCQADLFVFVSRNLSISVAPDIRLFFENDMRFLKQFWLVLSPQTISSKKLTFSLKSHRSRFYWIATNTYNYWFFNAIQQRGFSVVFDIRARSIVCLHKVFQFSWRIITEETYIKVPKKGCSCFPNATRPDIDRFHQNKPARKRVANFFRLRLILI